MKHNDCIVKMNKGKHLKWEERVAIEVMSRAGRPARDMAAALGRHPRTIERELLKGRVEHKDSEWRTSEVYSADRGQDVHDLNATAKGPALKLASNYSLVDFVRERIIDHKESPEVVAFRMAQAGLDGAVCAKTLYSYIDQGLIKGVSNESLWEKRKRKKRVKRPLWRSAKRFARGQSIEQRSPEVESREEFGHWEMDLVTGPTKASNTALLTLLERKHRKLITRKIPDKTQASVLRVLKQIEREYGPSRFREIFKSITVDNGAEFLDFKALSRSAFSKQERCKIFYAHPYASWERGSNENVNRVVRRFVAKGRDIKTFTHKRIHEIEQWINNYPRKLLDFRTPNQLFKTELEAFSQTNGAIKCGI